ncbi:uncharacterized protein LOC135615432 [Musa acuminata AAA Group]|uniref:uncharacterized protein LOC135615432 n=1 Tax=Musa acuminata AAA Group TaxID=214697 RepID=UPI0031D89131
MMHWPFSFSFFSSLFQGAGLPVKLSGYGVGMRGCYGDPDDMHGLPGGIDEGILVVMRWNLRKVFVDLEGQSLPQRTCKDNSDKAFGDCSIPQEKTNSEINAELEISDASCDDVPKPNSARLQIRN